MRKNFPMFLLSALPFLQEYGNISYHSSETSDRAASDTGSDRESTSQAAPGHVLHHDKRSRSLQNKKLDSLKPVVPIVSIEMPD